MPSVGYCFAWAIHFLFSYLGSRQGPALKRKLGFQTPVSGRRELRCWQMAVWFAGVAWSKVACKIWICDGLPFRLKTVPWSEGGPSFYHGFLAQCVLVVTQWAAGGNLTSLLTSSLRPDPNGPVSEKGGLQKQSLSGPWPLLFSWLRESKENQQLANPEPTGGIFMSLLNKLCFLDGKGEEKGTAGTAAITAFVSFCS